MLRRRVTGRDGDEASGAGGGEAGGVTVEEASVDAEVGSERSLPASAVAGTRGESWTASGPSGGGEPDAAGEGEPDPAEAAGS